MRNPLFYIACLPLIACKPDPLPGEPNAPQLVTAGEIARNEGSDPPLLMIGDRPLTMNEFDRRSQLMSPTAQLRLATAQNSQKLLEMIVWAELVAIEATRLELVGGLDEQVLVNDAHAQGRLEAMAAISVNRGAITVDEVRALYDATADTIQRAEERRVYTIVRPDRESAEALQAEVATLTEHDRASRVYSYLAPIHSTHELSRATGLVGMIRADGDGDPEFLAAVFSSEDRGLVSEIPVTSRGYEVIYVDRIVPAREVPFDEYEGRLREQMHASAVATRQRNELDRLRDEAGVELNTDAISALSAARADEPESTPRERRFSHGWLSGSPEAELGVDVMVLLEEEVANARANPLAALNPNGFVALEGSAEPTEGSGSP
ncbi:MAG: hypothetical protein ACJAYU_000061 [Bradymonadia bacterium]